MWKRVSFSIMTLAALAAAPLPAAAQGGDWTIVAGVRVGAITPRTGEDALRSLFGAGRVTAQRVQIGEGFVCEGARVEFEDGDALEITWLDAGARHGVADVRVFGRRWASPQGLRTGLTLREVEALNDGPFDLSGFGWDYGGGVLSWRSGKLDALPGQPATRFAPTREELDRLEVGEFEAIMGDREVASSDPAMQKLNPRVGLLLVRLGGERRCREFDGE